MSVLLRSLKLLQPSRLQRSATLLNSSRYTGATHRVNNLEKKFLVWTGKFKRVEDIPPYLHQDIVEKARNRMRIRIANYMMVLTLLACGAMAYSGKKARERGDTLSNRTLEWHKQLQEEAEREKLEQANGEILKN